MPRWRWRGPSHHSQCRRPSHHHRPSRNCFVRTCPPLASGDEKPGCLHASKNPRGFESFDQKVSTSTNTSGKQSTLPPNEWQFVEVLDLRMQVLLLFAEKAKYSQTRSQAEFLEILIVPSRAKAPTFPWSGGRYFGREAGANRACSPKTKTLILLLRKTCRVQKRKNPAWYASF